MIPLTKNEDMVANSGRQAIELEMILIVLITIRISRDNAITMGNEVTV